MISMIVATSKNHVIGKDNQLPWRMPADLAYFKARTLAKPIIMGRKTYESIGRPLPKRRNIVITRQSDFKAAGCDVYQSIEAALEASAAAPEVMIIGGATIYEQALPFADRIYRTIIDIEIDGDAYFPALDPLQWTLLEEKHHAPDTNNAHAYTFQVVEKNKNQ